MEQQLTMLKMILISFLGNLSSFAQSFAPFGTLVASLLTQVFNVGILTGLNAD